MGSNNDFYYYIYLDDDVALAEISADMLESYGYRVTIASDGEEAYKLISDNFFIYLYKGYKAL